MAAKGKAQQPAASPERPIISMATKAAMTALEEAGKALADRRKIADSIAVGIATTSATIAQLDTLPELSASQVVEQENARRRIKRLRAEAAIAQQRVDEAARPYHAARRRVDATRLQDLDRELAAMDATFIVEAKACSTKLAAMRHAILGKIRAANELYRSLRPANEILDDGPRGTTAGLGSAGDDALIAAARAIQIAESRRRQLAEQAQIGKNPSYQYKPPRDEHGNLDTN